MQSVSLERVYVYVRRDKKKGSRGYVCFFFSLRVRPSLPHPAVCISMFWGAVLQHLNSLTNGQVCKRAEALPTDEGAVTVSLQVLRANALHRPAIRPRPSLFSTVPFPFPVGFCCGGHGMQGDMTRMCVSWVFRGGDS